MFTFGFILETRLKRISVHKRELYVDNIDNVDNKKFEFLRQEMTTVTKCDFDQKCFSSATAAQLL